MALEVVQHGVQWVNEIAKEKIKCPECGEKRYTKQYSLIEDATVNVARITFTCQTCCCIFKLERQIEE